jgi:Ca2+-binding RTX toxin-like protein
MDYRLDAALRRGRLRRAAVIAALGSAVLSWTAATDARAQAAPPPKSIVSSTTSGGMIYAGTDTRNVLTVKLENNLVTGTRFLLDDIVPIQANAGCTADPQDATKASCVSFKKPDGSLKEFYVFGRKGNDAITNLTPVSMIAHGEEGRDELVGGGRDDTLVGGPGNDDYLDGKLGPDTLDGGPGDGDVASYANRTAGVQVTANDNLANDGKWTLTTSEGDNVTSSVEDIIGTDGPDNITGNDSDNVIVTGDGSDMLWGQRGADILLGGRGNDFLSSSANLNGASENDGAVDRLAGDFFGSNEPGSNDSCSYSKTDPDIVESCEQL